MSCLKFWLGMRVAIYQAVDVNAKGATKMKRYDYRSQSSARFSESRADRTTTWLLLLVVTALVIALTFSDASGSSTGLLNIF